MSDIAPRTSSPPDARVGVGAYVPPAPGAPPAGTRPAGRATHLLTFALEEYFNNFDRLIDRAHWSRFERRVEHGTTRVLDLLDAHRQRATFFCVGWVAEHLPDLVGEIARRGHEVASKGYAQQPLAALTPGAFRDDLARARDVIERVTGTRVLGYRAPGWLGPEDLWALDVLAAESYAYDSSLKPFLRHPHGGAAAGVPRRLERPAGAIWELPVSAVRVGAWHLPVGAGNYSRQLPRWLMRRVLHRWDRTHQAPFVMYFHAWEFDAAQPQISAAPWLDRMRFYRNLDKTPDILADYLARFRFTGAAEYLGISPLPPAPQATPAPGAGATVALAHPAPAPPVGVSLVVPCYNEERTLAYLANTLDSVRASLAGRYALEVVFVDDGSTDETAAALARHFGARADCRVVRHAVNRGVGQAILTGAARARYDVVASIDCDCTYDPHELVRMLPLLTDGVDVVTGSPYHPDGGVRNVPRWRLGLSRSASACYRRVLRQQLRTYTSCFRVYRRTALEGLTLAHGGFLGVAETLGRLDLAGARIVEFPTTLHVRVLGRSKMKVVRTVGGHVVLLAQLAALRARDALAARRTAPRRGAPAAPSPALTRDFPSR
ncbi:hypothetical protein tb265_25740 [Gemmatimonadetes bacterium T265]|nr:hypothetical protein tb265_25740 [Gemmatimonadetes bacterium T265]